MAREIEAPPSADDKMARRAPKDKNPDPLAKKVKALMQISKEDKEKDMSFDEKFKKAGPEKRKMMLAKGGYVKKADGCAKKGKTRGKMV